MAKRTIVWTETAIAQRREILKYWTKRNGSTTYAEKLIKLTAKQINLILLQPESFKLSEYPKTYESAMGHFSIYYKLTSTQLIVIAFWDNRQDSKKLFEIVNK